VIDASRQIEEWFKDRRERWRRQGVDARLRLPQSARTDKAVITFEETSHVCSLTVRRGTVEFIVMRTDAPPAIVSFDREFGNAAELGAILEAFARQLERVSNPSRRPALARPAIEEDRSAHERTRLHVPARRSGRPPSRA
jgi:hypothetical protein